MAISDYKITAEDIAKYGCVSLPDTLTGNAQENKAKFDRLVRECVANAVNAVIDHMVIVENEAQDWADAEALRVRAEATRAAAENLRVQAENGRTDAETARASAETARALSEHMREQAEAARAEAEDARDGAENDRMEAEQGRIGEEEYRASAEKERVRFENGRQQAEDKRVQAEAGRKTAETARTEAETAREQAETARTEAESERDDAENYRINAEQERADEEESRLSAEKERVRFENGRQQAEGERESLKNALEQLEGKLETAEDSRVQAEAGRVLAETTRAEAETARVEAEKARAAKDAERDGKISTLDAQLKAVSEELAKGIGNAETTDAVFANFLDGSNTTSVFWSWWPLSATGDDTKYDRLSRWAAIMATAWASKTYTLRSIVAEKSGGVHTMTPMDDLADKQPAQLCTESTVSVADWADEDPMTWYIRANALSKQDGTMDVLAIEGEDGFDLTGETAPVYQFSLALWLREWTDGDYDYISYRTTQADGYYPDAADVGMDNAKRLLTWHPCFPGGLNSRGGLTSGAGLKPYNFASAVNGIEAARKVTAYEGIWNDCDTRWALRMWQLRHFDLENSGICEGCLNYNYQYRVAKAESDATRVLLTKAQAANLLVGSTVSVGDPGSATDYDRSNAAMRNLAGAVQITDIADVEIDGTTYAAVTLDLSAAITTTATTYISTWPYISGHTECLPGHKDGCGYSLTAGKTPMRVMGVELLDGAYCIGLDPLYTVSAGSDASHWNCQIFECRDSEKLAGSVTADYLDTSLGMTDVAQGWNNWVKDFSRTRLGVLVPRLFGGSSGTYYRSAFYGAYSAGARCPWRFGNLSYGGNGGLACGNGNDWPGHAGWHGRPRLSGAGKKRGEWAE